MIFAVDIGNTNIVIGGAERQGKICFTERISTDHKATDFEYAVSFKSIFEIHNVSPHDIEGAIISSVVPFVTNTVKSAVKKIMGITPMVVGPGIKTGLSIKIDNPAQLGSDLVVGAVAGINEYPCPLAVIDMGTAIFRYRQEQKLHRRHDNAGLKGIHGSAYRAHLPAPEDRL